MSYKQLDAEVSYLTTVLTGTPDAYGTFRVKGDGQAYRDHVPELALKVARDQLDAARKNQTERLSKHLFEIKVIKKTSPKVRYIVEMVSTRKDDL
jgi:hypothetical protein